MKKIKRLSLSAFSFFLMAVMPGCSQSSPQLSDDSNNSGLNGYFSDPVKTVIGTSIIVAKDGTGSFTTIQSAIDSVPDGNTSWITIVIKNGTYNEHVFIDKNFIALIGENRESTRIEYELNRATWNTLMKVTNTGSGVIDIGVDSANPISKVAVSDVLIGNLSVVNTVAFLSSGTVYTHAIRGESTATRISIISCNVLATGSDTLALWNTTTGMYYHSDCTFQGGIDAVCPRGWCYDIGSTYIETKNSAPIWHEGAVGSGQKFVIRNAYVKPDTAKNFKLLNGQKESTVYMLDSYLYNSSGKTIQKGSVYASYFCNVHMEGGDLSWHADNLSSASGAPTQLQITTNWTFDGQWDPENTLPAALPYASVPRPWNKAYGMPTSSQLQWLNARDAISYNVYFGTTQSPPLLTNTTAHTISPGQLTAGTTYYWRVDTVTANGIVTGVEWSFTTN
jgi:pectinesterase